MCVPVLPGFFQPRLKRTDLVLEPLTKRGGALLDAPVEVLLQLFEVLFLVFELQTQAIELETLTLCFRFAFAQFLLTLANRPLNLGVLGLAFRVELVM